MLDADEIAATSYVCNGAAPVIENVSVAGSPAGLTLAYDWSVDPAWTVAAGAGTNELTLTTPAFYGESTTVTVTVTDTDDRTATAAAPLATEGNDAPVIESFSILAEDGGTSLALSASASDPFGNALSYAWTIGGSEVGTVATADWTSPGIPGQYLAEPRVSDGVTEVSAQADVSVASPNPRPRFRRNLQGTGQGPAAPAATGALRWDYLAGTVGAQIFSSPAVAADGTVYVGSNNDSLLALRPDGSLKWSYAAGNNIVSSPAIGADGTVYVGSLSFRLYAIE